MPYRPGDALVDVGQAAGYKIMAQAGVLPEEFRIQKEIDAHKADMPEITDPDRRKEAMAELARLQMRHAVAQKARRTFTQN